MIEKVIVQTLCDFVAYLRVALIPLRFAWHGMALSYIALYGVAFTFFFLSFLNFFFFFLLASWHCLAMPTRRMSQGRTFKSLLPINE